MKQVPSARYQPILALNFKAYPESAGQLGAKLALEAESAAAKYDNCTVISCPQATELSLLAGKLKHSQLFAQAADPVEAGAKTGFLAPANLKLVGCTGTLVNHSEHPLLDTELVKVVSGCKAAGLHSMVCAPSLDSALEIAVEMSPWAVAFEPPELIGSGVSVSSAKPVVVQEFAALMKKKAPNVIPIVGAGVSNPQDFSKCLELGAQGVLLASAFVKAKDHSAWLKAMLNAI